ncbi:MAG: M13 family metallopeptidase [Ignavibacteriaceae bacterium]|nr:M13 family metallopeptidase [Ignavibacteriaceae bacterium]
MKKLFSLLLLFPLFIFAGPDPKDTDKGLDQKNIDQSVSPAVDFYQYAIGNWLKNNPIPDEYTRWGSFEILAEQNNNVLKEILESAATKSSLKGSNQQKIGDYYFAGMDTVKIEKDGYKPILAQLKAIKGIKTKKDLYKEIAFLHLRVDSPFFGFGVGADAKNSSMNIPHIFQSGLGLPDKDYYLNDDARSKEIRGKYIQLMANMFKLVGIKEADAKKDANKVMEIETRLAKGSSSRVERRDPVKNYNKMSFDSLKAISPDIDWKLYFTSLGISTPSEYNVNQPRFIKEVSALLKDVKINDLKPYLRWNLIRGSANYLSSAFVNENFEFSGKFMQGAKVMQPRWKRVMQATNGALGEILGEVYVSKTFPPEAKERAKNIVNNLISALNERITNLDWMGSDTKKAALNKLAAITIKIGYPDKWKDYSALQMSRNSYFENDMNASEFLNRQDFDKIGKPVDKTEWGMLPQTVNAYYNPVNNEIVFPAAILQPPFFNVNADDAVNYGGMGVVIGHEITHGFDDSGRMYDAQGNIKDWWTESDAKNFEERGKAIVNQFNSIAAIDTFHVNGALTEGENIADLGGLKISLTALKKTDEYKSGEKINGFTPVQRFFLSFAQIWENNIRDEALKLRLKTDPHSPGKQRVNAPLSNMPEFWEAFGVKPGDPMRMPDAKLVKIW